MKTLTTTIFILLITVFAYSADFTEGTGSFDIVITPPENTQNICAFLLVFRNMDDDVLFKVEITQLIWRYQWIVEHPEWTGETLKITGYSVNRYLTALGFHEDISLPSPTKTVEFTTTGMKEPVLINLN